jgi:hypothetical protein
MKRSGRRASKVERKHERFEIDLRLLVKAATILHGRTKNLAESGMGATIAGEIPLGELVELQFQLPDSSQPMVLRAEVRFRQGFQYGFKFVFPTEEQLHMIRNTIRGPKIST